MNERDPDLEKLYREHSREEPPSALDAAIVAAAHRAVDSGPRHAGAQATRPQRWWMPLAAAAAIGVVAIGIVQQVPKDSAIDATSVATAPPPSSAPVPPPPAAPAPAPMQAPAASAETQPAPSRDVGALAKKQKAVEAPAAPAPPPAVNASKLSSQEKPAAARENKVAEAPTPFPAAPPPQKTEAESAKRDAPMEQSFAESRRKDTVRDERQAGSAAGALATSPSAAPAPPAPASVARMRAQSDAAGGVAQTGKNVEEDMRTLARDPDAWIVRIRKLRDDGNVAQASRELKEFRALVPDAERRLPPDLRDLQP